MKLRALWQKEFKKSKEVLTNPSLDLSLIFCHVLGIKKEDLFSSFNDEIPQNKAFEIENLTEKARKKYPIAYITNNREFMGLDFFVDQRVLIPRPDTEILVEKAIYFIEKEAKNGKIIKILDLCCGSGCIGLSIKNILKEKVDVILVDIDNNAMDVAQINRKNLNLDVTIIQSNLFNNLGGKKFNYIISNPPYLTEKETIDREKNYEPLLALNGFGDDGLKLPFKLLEQSKGFLLDSGSIFLELAMWQIEKTKSYMEDIGFVEIESFKDLSLGDRVIRGKFYL